MGPIFQDLTSTPPSLAQSNRFFVIRQHQYLDTPTA
jgi:hypothetical protein